MKNYFEIYNYDGNMKSWLTIFNLTTKDSIWWQDMKVTKNIKEKGINWKEFK